MAQMFAPAASPAVERVSLLGVTDVGRETVRKRGSENGAPRNESVPLGEVIGWMRPCDVARGE